MNYLPYVIPLWLVYLVLTGNGQLSNVLVGLILSVGIVALFRPDVWPTNWRRLPGALLALLQYLLLLAIDLLRSGLQTARIVLSPTLPIKPGIIAIPSDCESELGQALSAHAITVTPGEMVVEMSGDGVMYTHCLDATHVDAIIAGQRKRRDLLQKIFD